MLRYSAPGGVFLINAPYAPYEIWHQLPVEVQKDILDKQLELYVIDAYKVAEETGMGRRINTVMQTCFFAISGVLPRDEAIAEIKKSIEKTYGRKGPEIVKKNFEAVDQTLANLHKVEIPAVADSKLKRLSIVSEDATDFVKRVSGLMLGNMGDLLPVSAFPVDGTWPTATSQYEKRAIALEIPEWDSKICIQCNKCAMVCPHAAIRPKYYDAAELEKAPATFKSVDFKSPEIKGKKYTLQVAGEDCTGCTICVMVCPVKDKANPKNKAINMVPLTPVREQERENYKFYLALPDPDRTEQKSDVKTSQFLQPLIE
jgi:pyruvate-ferredoxin/flavodoxin oxidoreductase